ncbi:2-oxoadipate dioxygenase/decarboxylase [Aeromicrobium fastidiosum]|uniref:2-oxoadipate dioxygenase/decarboxylase n=1 Tax=Aeromicrobium fastidiosum TaxID=52699 RepID=A0A641ALH8_9ACTN|nr:VOC family protein [Aeromicrobium fastidiosum]KAA1378140.1 VOC family protein [Aeromicrobium fastidiosum]MBP2389059.1 putative glyoxalase superfamily metalloenzyme YdcJ [Aeromicrobium fastidiosum]
MSEDRGFAVSPTTLRSRFARALSELYGREVPAYTTLVEVSAEVNADVLATRDDAERLGSIRRVTAERHGAIRLGTPDELAQVARIFGACGMYPVGFYDLREATPAIPVVSTAFRPVARPELRENPFRVFTSLLVVDDRRFFDERLEAELREFLAARTLFPRELLELADRMESEHELSIADADRFIELATAAFALSPEPVDRDWYERLEAVSSVAADIGGVASTHINHLTPRVLDIDELYRRMQSRGIEMIDRIQGPPRTAPGRTDVLLRQTSFRALAEPRSFREVDGTIVTDSLRVRFGEVEQRGVALTPAGRERYDAEGLGGLPDSDADLHAHDLAYFTRTDAGVLVPIVYEDFLPKSAAGIFASNLTGEGSSDTSRRGSLRDAAWMQDVLGRTLHDPYELYAAERAGA